MAQDLAEYHRSFERFGGAAAGAGSDDESDYGGSGDEYSSVPSRSPSTRSLDRRWKHVTNDDVSKNFMVVIRVRPPLPRELHGDRPFQNVVRVDQSERQITISDNFNDGGDPVSNYGSYTFTFDRVYDQNCDQRKVYETTAKAVVESSLQGYNATIFAYGQTGTGKTYTMEGFNSAEERGIIPRAIEQIFRHIQSTVSPRVRFLVRASYLQIYNEVISDLLKPERTNLVIREDKRRGVFVEGLSEWVVRSPQEIYGLMERGGLVRATGSTKMNELSSRSHAVFIIIAEQSETTYLDEHGHELSAEEFHRLVKSRAHGELGLKQLEANIRQSFKVGKLNLVDLAGSERVRLTGATGQRLEESKKINQSLSALGNVIAALTDPKGRQHIPYRDSKLTRILEDSLGGNCKTTMMAMISPALEAYVESLSTIKFANRAKNIKNEAKVNEDLDQKSLLRRYERELKKLRCELEERNRNVVDNRKLLELEEERRRAEADKMAAIRELEARSRAFMKEKAEKRKLEHRIAELQGQMLTGGPGAGSNVKDTPAFRNAIKEHQERIRQEYEKRLSDLERERETIEEEKAQVDRYKQLLLKQRDIMVMLTQRLNERDEQIVALQDELDAYDRHQRELEEKLDEKTAALIHLQRVTMEHNAASPVKNNELEQALGLWATGGGPRGLPEGLTAGPRGTRDGALQQFRAAQEEIADLNGRLLDSQARQQELSKQLAEAQAHASALERRMSSQGGRAPSDPTSAGPAAMTSETATLRSTNARLQAEVAELRRMLGGRTNGPDAEDAQSRLSQLSQEHASLRADMAARLEEKNILVQRLEEENRALRVRTAGTDKPRSSAASDAATSGQVVQLQQRIDMHVKERRAIQTIMEDKIKTLVDGIAVVSRTAATGRDAPRLLREVNALQTFVNASISALRNSEAGAKAAAAAAAGSTGSSATTTPASTPATSTRPEVSAAEPPQPPLSTGSSRSPGSSLGSTPLTNGTPASSGGYTSSLGGGVPSAAYRSVGNGVAPPAVPAAPGAGWSGYSSHPSFSMYSGAPGTMAASQAPAAGVVGRVHRR